MGGCFLSAGPADLEPDEKPDRRRVPDLRGVPDAVDHRLDRRVVRARRPATIVNYLSITRALRRLRARHHRHEARRLLPELHHLRAVPDGQVGRQRTVARVTRSMLKRVLGLLGWLGVALVFAARGDPLHAAGMAAVVQRRWRWPASPARCSTSSASGARSRDRSRGGRRGSAPGGGERRRRARRFWSRSTTSASRHNKRWDLTAAKQFSLSDQTKKVLQGLQKPVQHPGVRPDRRVPAVPRAARRVPVRVASR